jgi:secondary thiamine-phosphate synthase enzyme
MATFQKTFVLRTHAHDEVVDITALVEGALSEAGAEAGQCTVFTPHATAAITINENDDPNIGKDLLDALDRMVPRRGGWLHDRIDGNAAAHIKSAVVGPSETIPFAEGRLCLGTWQNVFFCELDGPRLERRVIVSIVW